MVVPGAGEANEGSAVVRRLRWDSAALSDRGLRRERNEDSLLLRAEAGLFAVADGMGGHAAGEVASRIAVEVLAAGFAEGVPATAEALSEQLAATFMAANRGILQHARDEPSCRGMGTTLTVFARIGESAQCVVAHIGDSRAYRLRGNELLQLTHDHTWVQEQVDAGMLTVRAARHHRLASVLNRVLGTPESGPPDTSIVEAEPGDLYLLCSDGLTTMMEDADLERMLARKLPLEQHARDLVDAANQRGGADNITVLLLRPEAG
jgi:PPM family protein phosphatase